MNHHPILQAQHRPGHPPLEEAMAADEDMVETVEKEQMFEKMLTRSDVGTLNRLVIPKKHAEMYFPIGGHSGISLLFEDNSGNGWEFKYSYWSSSQSYVLTKGWNDYVREKELAPGDVVVFGRLRANHNRKFIGFRRRMAVPPTAAYPAPNMPPPYQPEYPHDAGVVDRNEMTPRNGKSKILRLFGVDIECESHTSENDVPETLSDSGSPALNQNQALYHQNFITNGHSLYPHNNMEYNMSGDENQMRYYRQG